MSDQQQPQGEFKQSLSLFDATMLVAGVMIGSGIFIVSADIARSVGSAGWLLVAWLLSGFLTMIAALSYGELAGMMPKAGGQYVYLREAWNPLTGFLFGWTQFLVIQAGTIAAVAVAFAKFTAVFFPELSPDNVLFQIGFLKISAAQIVAIALIAALTIFHTRGVEGGKMMTSIFTVTKIASLIGLILLGLFVGFNPEVWAANWENGWQKANLGTDGTVTLLTSIGLLVAFGTSMVGSLFSMDSWNNVTFIAGEIKNPRRNIPLSLVFGTGIVCILYILTNIVYLAVLPMNEIAHAPLDRVGTAAAGAIFGASGIAIMAALIMVSTFGCNIGQTLGGARLGYAMAVDGLFVKQAARLNKNGVPAWALYAQMIWASILCLSGTYGALLDYTIFAALLFYALTVAGIFRLRVKMPDAERPYRAVGYPVIPALYVVLALAIAVILLIYKTENTLPGLAIVLLGIPVYFWQRRNARKN